MFRKNVRKKISGKFFSEKNFGKIFAENFFAEKFVSENFFRNNIPENKFSGKKFWGTVTVTGSPGFNIHLMCCLQVAIENFLDAETI